MSRYRYAVKVRPFSHRYGLAALWHCEGCGKSRGVVAIQPGGTTVLDHLDSAHESATDHAAECEALHRANWAACCDSCRSFGRPAKACIPCHTKANL